MLLKCGVQITTTQRPRAFRATAPTFAPKDVAAQQQASSPDVVALGAVTLNPEPLQKGAGQVSLAATSAALPATIAAATAGPLRMILAGPPGGGKGTQSDFIEKRWGATHLSTGEMLREEVKRDTELGRKAKEYMDRGELVPDDIMLDLVRSRIEKEDSFILDGFPRSIPQAEGLDDMLADMKKPLTTMVALDVDDDVIVKRLLARGRADDTEEVIRNRLKVYHEQTEPAIAHYRGQGLVESVPAAGSIEATRDLVLDRIEKRLDGTPPGLNSAISFEYLLQQPSVAGPSAREFLGRIDQMVDNNTTPYPSGWSPEQRRDVTAKTKELIAEALEVRPEATLPELAGAAKAEIDDEVQAIGLSPKLTKVGGIAAALGAVALAAGLWQGSPTIAAAGFTAMAGGGLMAAVNLNGGERHTEQAKTLGGTRDILEGWSVLAENH